MPSNKLYKFKRIEDVTNFLNGGVVGACINQSHTSGSPGNFPGVNGLVGKTLIFTLPASVTVTFTVSNTGSGSGVSPGTNPNPQVLLFKDIKAQIEAVVTGAVVFLNADQQLVIIESTPSGGVSVAKTGTANSILGFNAVAATVGKVYSPSVVSPSPPCWTWANIDVGGMHSIHTWES